MAGVRLSRRTVAALQPKDARYSVFDADLPGFGVRVFPSGAMSWIVEYRPGSGGRGVGKRRITIAPVATLSPEKARERAETLLAEAKLGGDPAGDKAENRKGVTVRELVDIFLAEHLDAKRKARTAEDYLSLFNQHLLPEFGSRKAADLADDDLARLHVRLTKTKVRANRLMSAISSMYGFASRRKLVPKGYNPAADIEKYREEKKERFLTIDELGRIGEAIREAETVGIPWEPDPTKQVKHAPKEQNRRTRIDQHAAAALRLLLFTGARLREILKLEWTHYDASRGILFLPDSKTGKKSIILNAPAVAILSDLPRIGRYVIAGATAGTKEEKPRSDLKRPKAKVWKRAGVSEARLHDLRHTHASFGADAGFSLPMIGKLLGHAQASTTERYAHLTNDPVRKASERIGGDIAAALGEGPKGGGDVVPMRRK
jgi:integrase